MAHGLCRRFGWRTAHVTSLADNPLGRLAEDLMLQGGVNLSHRVWLEYDGVGRAVRNGRNFTERGFGVRAALGCSERGQTAVSQLNYLLGKESPTGVLQLWGKVYPSILSTPSMTRQH